MIRFGTVSIVNNEKGKVKVTFQDLGTQSEELIVYQGRTTGTKEYQMPVVGENGLCLIVDNGNTGYYLGSGFSLANPVPEGAAEGKDIKVYSDGTRIEYDEKTSRLYIDCKKKIEIICPEIFINGKVKVKGDIEVIEGDIKADGISLKKHLTTGVSSGKDVSGPPQ
ncbi:MAG: phage baseplate assembly protein V [Fusobacterium ulcerans]|uniref:phage baseplate assembly protein V n=1 Tax=Fusobacterium ulcerans TaxID=861 RepID=UPI003A897715